MARALTVEVAGTVGDVAGRRVSELSHAEKSEHTVGKQQRTRVSQDPNGGKEPATPKCCTRHCRRRRNARSTLRATRQLLPTDLNFSKKSVASAAPGERAHRRDGYGGGATCLLRW